MDNETIVCLYEQAINVEKETIQKEHVNSCFVFIFNDLMARKGQKAQKWGVSTLFRMDVNHIIAFFLNGKIYD